MTFIQIVFLFAAAVTLGAALMVVSARKIMHAALWLVLSLVGVAVLFALLESRFITVVQVIIYVGAIATLIIFGVMLTRRMMFDVGPQVVPYWGLAAFGSFFLGGALIFIISGWSGFWTVERAVPAGGEDLVALGTALVDPMGFVIPFEVSSILLLAAMLGAIFVASGRKRGEK